MKRKRVIATGTILSAILAAFLFLPLPVSRVRENGVVQISDGHREFVHIRENGILIEVMVYDGQSVGPGADLARFRNPLFEFERQQYEKERDAAQQTVNAIQAQLSAASGDPAGKGKLEKELREARDAFLRSAAQLAQREQLIRDTEVLKAPRSGIVMSVPKKEDMFKMWDRAEGQPLCSIGDPTKLRILIPVGAPDYREIRQNLARVQAEQPNNAFLEVTILPSRRSDKEFKGRITRLPDTDEKNVPLSLTHRGGGSLATKPGGDPNVNQPLVQTYLVAVEVDDPDNTLTPGTMAMVKVHLRWRSTGWWAWRTIASALDIGLW